MLKQYSCFIVFVWAVFSITLVNAESKAEPPLISASIRPLTLLVEDLAGGLVRTETVINNAASPHDFSLTIAQALKLSESDLLVWVGPDVESFLIKHQHTAPNLSMAAIIEKQHQDHGDQNEHDDHHEDGHHHGQHLWLGYDNIRYFAQALSLQLQALLPQHSKELKDRLSKFEKRLTTQERKNRKRLLPHKNTAFVVYHDAYGAYVSQHELNQKGQLTKVPNERISAKRLNEVGNSLKGAACLLTERGEQSQAERYGKLFETSVVGIDLLAVDPNTGSFTDYLETLTNSFIQCFEANSL